MSAFPKPAMDQLQPRPGYHDSVAELLGPLNDHSSPLIICFHGSGDSCASWQGLSQQLCASHRVLLYNRGPLNPKPAVSVPEMARYLVDHQLAPPYLLIGHSYGGAFLRQFLQQYASQVAGVVLVETGQETALDAALEESQYRKQILGSKPLVVIRGNSMIQKFKQLEEHSLSTTDQKGMTQHESELRLLQAWDEEDERLKKRQLSLSRNNHYIHVPDCGHHVIRDRPDLVVDAVEWVLQNQGIESRSQTSYARLRNTLTSVTSRFRFGSKE